MAAKKPMDHLRKEAGEPDGPFALATISGREGSVEVEVLHPFEWAFDVQDLIAQARFGAVFEGIMDEKNASAAKAVRPSMVQAMDFVRSLGDAVGVTLGELQAS